MMSIIRIEQPTDSKITRRCFLDRLLPSEEDGIDLASYGETPQAAAIRRFMRRIQYSPFVDLSLDQTIEGLQLLESFGLIAEGRAAEIISTPIQEHERWRE